VPVLNLIWDGERLTERGPAGPDDISRALADCHSDEGASPLAQAFLGYPDGAEEILMMEAETGRLHLVFDPAGRTIGFWSLNNFEGSTARLHFCPAKAARPYLLSLARAVLSYCRALGLAAVVGITPVLYAGVRTYALVSGGRDMGTIPKMFYLTKLGRFCDGRAFVFDLQGGD